MGVSTMRWNVSISRVAYCSGITVPSGWGCGDPAIRLFHGAEGNRGIASVAHAACERCCSRWSRRCYNPLSPALLRCLPSRVTILHNASQFLPHHSSQHLYHPCGSRFSWNSELCCSIRQAQQFFSKNLCIPR